MQADLQMDRMPDGWVGGYPSSFQPSQRFKTAYLVNLLGTSVNKMPASLPPFSLGCFWERRRVL